MANHNGTNIMSTNQIPITTALANAALVIVPRTVATNGRRGGAAEGERANITSRPLPDDCKDEERVFLQNFENRLLDLITEFRREFPCQQTIRWSIEYGDDKQHNLHIFVKSPRSMNNNR